MHGTALAAVLFFRPMAARADEVRIPNVEEAMLEPGYWLRRMEKTGGVIMDAHDIARVNMHVLKRGYRVRPYRELDRVPGKRVRELMESQLHELSRWKKYDRDNRRMRDPGFRRSMAVLLDLEKIPKRVEVEFALTTGKTRVRLMPTDMAVQRRPDEPRFDILQSSALDAGVPLAVYHSSHNGDWRAVQAPYCFGWVRLESIAISSRMEVTEFAERRPCLVALANSVPVYADQSFKDPVVNLSIASRLPVVGRFSRGYVVSVPRREDEGRLSLGNGYVKASRNVSLGFLEMTVENILEMAFRQLHDPYGWGGNEEGTDCSKFIANIFSVFGFNMARTSFNQVKSFDYRLPPARAQERKAFLDSLPPGRTLLQFPGHVGLYLGKVKDRHYMIHSVIAYRVLEDGREREIRIDRVVVSDLSLGEGTKKGSYLDSLEAAGVVGQDPIPAR